MEAFRLDATLSANYSIQIKKNKTKRETSSVLSLHLFSLLLCTFKRNLSFYPLLNDRFWLQRWRLEFLYTCDSYSQVYLFNGCRPFMQFLFGPRECQKKKTPSELTLHILPRGLPSRKFSFLQLFFFSDQTKNFDRKLA